jgi:general secretion pathway protein A
MNDLQAHFGFSSTPFGKLPPAQAFVSDEVSTVSRKLKGVELVGGIAVCVGEPGVGKTYAVEAWSENLSPITTNLVWIDDPGDQVFSLLRRCVSGLHKAPLHNNDNLWQQFHEAFLKHRQAHRRLIFVIDEAQYLSFPMLEQIRRLTNLARTESPSLSFVLIAHREFLTPFRGSRLSSLKRRLNAVITLNGLSEDELEPYLRHHLAYAGTAQQLFCDDALRRLWSVSRGIPRLINTLALHCLLEAARHGLHQVDETVANVIIREEEIP